MLAFISVAASLEQLRILPNFGAHQLTGDRAGTWSLIVARNWRMTFRVTDALTIEDMDLEDYH